MIFMHVKQRYRCLILNYIYIFFLFTCSFKSQINKNKMMKLNNAIFFDKILNDLMIVKNIEIFQYQK